MREINRTLTIDITMSEDNCFVTVTDKESGLVTTIDVPYSLDGFQEFNEQIGNEILSWVSIMGEEFEEMEDDEYEEDE